MDVILIDVARDPLSKLYGAYRTCYTTKTPREVWEEIAEGKTSPEAIRQFVSDRLATGHVSPLEQVVFWFGISGVSRALSHQLVRHRIGISFEQQSQRYVKYKDDALDFITPKTIAAHPEALSVYEEFMVGVNKTYQKLVGFGIPAEDSRFVLPNATPTNFQIMVNFAELLHLGDLRLCHRAQWEIRFLMGLLRAEIRKAVPELARVMQPKCGECRMGYCDEDLKAYVACPLSKARPHKLALFKAWESVSMKGSKELTEADIQPESGK